MRATVYRRRWRMVVASLVALSRGSLPLILVRLLVANDPPITPPILMRLFVLFTVLPGALAWMLKRLGAAKLDFRQVSLIVERRRLRMEIPYDAIQEVIPWAVPLPGPGLSLRMRSGQLLRNVFEIGDPKPFLYELADHGVESVRGPLRHPVVVWANARASTASLRWSHHFGKFVLFALAPAAVLFNTHQHIAYGGLLGQYHLEGLGPYIRTFFVYWMTVAIYLVLYASVLRGLAEAIAFAAATVAPLSAVSFRRKIELGYRTLYYGGVPVLLALRYCAP